MKKWIFTVLLFGVGGLYFYDILRGYVWIQELFITLNEWNEEFAYHLSVVIIFLPFLFVLLNYFILRIRARNAAFTLINALFVSIVVIVLLLRQFMRYDAGIDQFFEILTNKETWQELWTFVPAYFILCGVNFVSGIVISEAKSKPAYLTAEFMYLLTAMFLMFATSRYLYF